MFDVSWHSLCCPPLFEFTMLRSANDLTDFSIAATDGDIGQVEGFCFDESQWMAHHIVLNTGGWLHARKVLIPSLSVERVDSQTRAIEMALTREEVKNCPAAAETQQHHGVAPAKLRSTKKMAGYSIAASDGAIGHLDDFIIDDETWTIRYLVVDTRNWWPGKKVMLSPRWIKRLDWKKHKVEVGLSRAQIEDSPEYDDSSVIDRDYEERLYKHYGEPGYWNG
jgi:uncharacterized protein YrrD